VLVLLAEHVSILLIQMKWIIFQLPANQMTLFTTTLAVHACLGNRCDDDGSGGYEEEERMK
jgi:hypothetical protein